MKRNIKNTIKEIMFHSSLSGIQFTIAVTQLMMSIIFLGHFTDTDFPIWPFIIYGSLAITQIAIMLSKTTHTKFGVCFSLVSSFSLWYLLVFGAFQVMIDMSPLLASYVAICLSSSWVFIRSGTTPKDRRETAAYK